MLVNLDYKSIIKEFIYELSIQLGWILVFILYLILGIKIDSWWLVSINSILIFVFVKKVFYTIAGFKLYWSTIKHIRDILKDKNNHKKDKK